MPELSHQHYVTERQRGPRRLRLQKSVHVHRRRAVPLQRPKLRLLCAISVALSRGRRLCVVLRVLRRLHQAAGPHHRASGLCAVSGWNVQGRRWHGVVCSVSCRRDEQRRAGVCQSGCARDELDTSSELVELDTSSELVELDTSSELVELDTSSELVELDTSSELVKLDTSSELV